MKSPEPTVLRQRLVRVITHRASASDGDVAAAARRVHDELTAVLAPLISSAGVVALSGRAFDLAQRQYPAEERRGDNIPNDEPFALVTRWLERQGPSVATDAAAALFAIFAELLTALIGEPLTTRYLEKAWPDVFADSQQKEKKA